MCPAGGEQSRTPAPPAPCEAAAAPRYSAAAGAERRAVHSAHAERGRGGAFTVRGVWDGLGKGWRFCLPVPPVPSRSCRETNWVSLSRLNPTNVAGFGSRCLRFLRGS